MHDNTQLLAKFKKILYMGFRATLNFRKFKMALNPLYIFWETCDFRKKKNNSLFIQHIQVCSIIRAYIGPCKMQCHSSKRNVVPVLYLACFFLSFHEINGTSH